MDTFYNSNMVDPQLSSEDIWEKIICWLIDSITQDNSTVPIAKAVRLTALQTLNNNMDKAHFKHHIGINFEYVI